jgi:hypothetical protein
MQRSPPGRYLAFNIFMWGVLLMAQAGATSFAGLCALRILSGAFEAIADPAFMLITSMVSGFRAAQSSGDTILTFAGSTTRAPSSPPASPPGTCGTGSAWRAAG